MIKCGDGEVAPTLKYYLEVLGGLISSLALEDLGTVVFSSGSQYTKWCFIRSSVELTCSMWVHTTVQSHTGTVIKREQVKEEETDGEIERWSESESEKERGDNIYICTSRMVACIYIYVHMDATCIFCDSYRYYWERERGRDRERYICMYTAHCSLLELTKCVIEPSTRPRVTCNSETIACHCLPGGHVLTCLVFFSHEEQKEGERERKQGSRKRKGRRIRRTF